MGGFSNTVVRIMKAEGVSFKGYNVLASPELREGIKEFSSWPTIPQLYVNGEFLGGCDILTEMAASGELFPALGVEPPPEIQPTIHLSDDAQEALLQAVQNSGGEGQLLRIGIVPAWQPSLSMSELRVISRSGEETETELSASATRAIGLSETLNGDFFDDGVSVLADTSGDEVLEDRDEEGVWRTEEDGG